MQAKQMRENFRDEKRDENKTDQHFTDKRKVWKIASDMQKDRQNNSTENHQKQTKQKKKNERRLKTTTTKKKNQSCC